jgi:uncharacterized protein (DUF1330 family)
MGLDITEEALGRFLAAAEGPVVLVNLVRLKAGGDEAYRLYGQAVAPLLARHGAELIYAGAAAGVLIGQERWDLAAVTRYPSRAALAALVRDPDFVDSAPLRHAALEDGVLYAFA